MYEADRDELLSASPHWGDAGKRASNSPHEENPPSC